jgi:hypothetical protein
MKNIKEERSQDSGVRKLEYWESLPPGERNFICCLMRMVRGAKRSQFRDVAAAATKWERGIGCFIKVRLIGACRTGQLSKALNPMQRQVCLRCYPPHPACDRWTCGGKAETLKVRAGLATNLK